jgi:hypothetical protein
MSEDRILQALQELSEHDHAAEAPAAVEARVVAAFRARKMRRRAAWVAVGAVAAGAVIAILLAPGRGPVVKISAEPPVPPVVEAAKPATVLVGKPAPRVAKSRPTPARNPTAPPPREFVTDFFSLMDSAEPFERGQLLRVNVPAGAMRTVGLPVREEQLAEPIQADVLVGEEGLPRAIRFVRFEVK